MGTETLRPHAEQVGTGLEEEHQLLQVQIERTRAPPATGYDPAPGPVVVETDGVMVRYRCPTTCGCIDGWHEVKLGVLGGWTGKRANGPTPT